jgi:hypothetical protein
LFYYIASISIVSDAFSLLAVALIKTGKVEPTSAITLKSHFGLSLSSSPKNNEQLSG